MDEEELIAFEAAEGAVPLGAVPAKRPRAYTESVNVLFGVQWGCHFTTSIVGVYMTNVDPSQRDGENMGDAQLLPCICLAACATIVLGLEHTIWRHRVRAARDDVAKHREDAPVPHGAVPVPDSGTPFSGLFRVVRYASFALAAVLAGATMPGTSMMLAPETPSGHTLGSAHIMAALSAAALGAMVGRHLAPYFGPGVTVFREDPQERRLALLAPIAATIICDAVVFGAAVVAAARPRTMVTSITPVRRAALSMWRSPPPGAPPTPSPSPPPPGPLAPQPPAPAIFPTWMGDVRGTMLGKIPTNPYGDDERDAMAIIAVMTAVAALAWLANAYYAAMPERAAKHRPTAAAAGIAAACVQTMLVGVIIPGVGIVGSTGSFARNVVTESPGAIVSWSQDPLTGVVTLFIVLASLGMINTCVVAGV